MIVVVVVVSLITKGIISSKQVNDFVPFCLSGFPDPGWKAFYDSATPHVEKMPDPWDCVSGLDR